MAENLYQILRCIKNKNWCANFYLSKAEKFSFSCLKFILNGFSGDQRCRWQLLYFEVEGSSSVLDPILSLNNNYTHISKNSGVFITHNDQCRIVENSIHSVPNKPKSNKNITKLLLSKQF